MFVNADVRTMDPAAPRAQAIAIDNGTIAYVGDDAGARALIGANTRTIDLGGATLTPGLVDAHCHLYGLGTDLESVSVRGQSSEVATAALAIEAAKTRAASEPLVGRGWDQTRWPGAAFPTKASLDAISDRPVVLRRVDGHAIWVNSKALALAGITKATKDPAGGSIVRDKRGEPTGVLVDNAIALVDDKLPVADAAIRERRIRAAAKEAIAAGITAVHEMGIDDATVAVYQQLSRAEQLPLHVYGFLAGDPGNLARFADPPPPPTHRFILGGVKFFADGALGSRGARLTAPYTDAPKSRGLWVTEPAQLAAAVTAATATGWQVAVHAIGDAAVAATLDAFAAAQKAHPGEHKFRVEHAQIVAPADIARLVSTHAIASMQPTHATSDMRWAEARIGRERITGAYAWRTMLEQKIPLAFGSDFPVEEVAPLLGIYAAVTRQDADGNPAGGWYPAQKLTLDEALAAFTSGAAAAGSSTGGRGVIAVGQLADVTVFDRALVADRSLLDTKVAYTIVVGDIVYEKAKQ